MSFPVTKAALRKGFVMRNILLVMLSALLVMVALPQMAAAQVYGLMGIDIDSGSLYTISTSNASLTLIGNTGISSMGDLEYNKADGFLYGFTVGNNASLYKISPQSWEITRVGSLGKYVFEGGLAFASDGTAYGTNLGSSGSELFKLNLATGAATIIGAISGGNHDINGLAYRSDGMLIGIDRVTNSLLQIDPTTASSSQFDVVRPTVGSVGGMTATGDTGFFQPPGQALCIPVPTNYTPLIYSVVCIRSLEVLLLLLLALVFPA